MTGRAGFIFLLAGWVFNGFACALRVLAKKSLSGGAGLLKIGGWVEEGDEVKGPRKVLAWSWVGWREC